MFYCKSSYPVYITKIPLLTKIPLTTSAIIQRIIIQNSRIIKELHTETIQTKNNKERNDQYLTPHLNSKTKSNSNSSITVVDNPNQLFINKQNMTTTNICPVPISKSSKVSYSSNDYPLRNTTNNKST